MELVVVDVEACKRPGSITAQAVPGVLGRGLRHHILVGDIQVVVHVVDGSVAVGQHGLDPPAEQAVLAVLGTTLYSVRRYIQTEKGGYAVDLIRLRFPLLGKLARKIAITRFASTFAQLMSSGVPIIQAMSIVGVATGNKVIGKAILDARTSVEQGNTVSATLKNNKEFPSMLIHMLAAGEQTGKMEEMLTKLAEFYQEEVDTMLEGLTSMLEPLLMVVIGVMIGGIVLAMFMPIFKMTEVVM